MKMIFISFYRQLEYLVSQQREQEWLLFTSHGLLFWKLMIGEILESISVKWRETNMVSNNVGTWYEFEKSIVIIELVEVAVIQSESYQCGHASTENCDGWDVCFLCLQVMYQGHSSYPTKTTWCSVRKCEQAQTLLIQNDCTRQVFSGSNTISRRLEITERTELKQWPRNSRHFHRLSQWVSLRPSRAEYCLSL